MDSVKLNGYTALHEAAWSGHIAVVVFLVEHGAEVAAKDNDWDTPLHLASVKGRLPVVEFLVEKGKVDVESKNKYELTPLHLVTSFDLFIQNQKINGFFWSDQVKL